MQAVPSQVPARKQQDDCREVISTLIPLVQQRRPKKHWWKLTNYPSKSTILPTKALLPALPSVGRSTLYAQPSKEESHSMATDAEVRQAEAAA